MDKRKMGKSKHGKRYCFCCSNYKGKIVDGRTVSLHRVPADKSIQRAWVARLKVVKKNGKDFSGLKEYMRVCSEHFVQKQGPQPGDEVPSLFSNKIFKTCTVPHQKQREQKPNPQERKGPGSVDLPVVVVTPNDRDSRDTASESSSNYNAGVMQRRLERRRLQKIQEEQSKKQRKKLLLQTLQHTLKELQQFTQVDCAMYLVDRELHPPIKMMYGHGPIKHVMLNCVQLHQSVLQAYNIPAMKKMSLLSTGLLQNNLNVAEGSSAVLASATPVSLASATPVSLPSATPVSLPSATPDVLPSVTPVSLVKNVASQGCSDTIGVPYAGATSPHKVLPSSKIIKVINRTSASSSSKTSPRVNLVYDPASKKEFVVKVEVDEPDEMLWRSMTTAERTGEVEATNPHHQGECHAEAEVTAENNAQVFENNFSRTCEKRKQMAENASPHASAKKPRDRSLVDNYHNSVGYKVESESVPSLATDSNSALEMHVKIEPFENNFSRTCEKRKQTAEKASPHASAKKPRDRSLVDNCHNNAGEEVESEPVPSLATDSNTALEMHVKIEPFENNFSRTCEKRKQTAEKASPHASAMKKPRDHSLVDNCRNNVGDEVESEHVPSHATQSNPPLEMHLKLEPEWD